MDHLQFQKNKVRRLIKSQGNQFTFTIESLDEYNEPNGQTESVNIDGVYHETTGYLFKKASDSSTVKQKSSPMIVCLWDDAKKLSPRHTLDFNGHKYTVGDIKNVSEANIVGEISLEEIQNG